MKTSETESMSSSSDLKTPRRITKNPIRPSSLLKINLPSGEVIIKDGEIPESPASPTDLYCSLPSQDEADLPEASNDIEFILDEDDTDADQGKEKAFSGAVEKHKKDETSVPAQKQPDMSSKESEDSSQDIVFTLD